MSAPDTNIEKQASRHRPSLMGIGAAAVFVVLLTLGAIFVVMGNDAGPGIGAAPELAAPADN